MQLLSAVLVVFAVAMGTAQAEARKPEKRVALVIGNARYPSIPLANPENDARLIADNLRKLGFEVNEQLNLGRARSSAACCATSRAACRRTMRIAVLYYAGHGVQIDGRNYLLPVDINLRDQEEVKDESVDIEELFLGRIDKARSHARIVILDACRDNPFAGKTRNIRSAGGLAEMGARGTLIAYRLGARRAGGGRAGRAQQRLHPEPGRRDDGAGPGSRADVQERAGQGAARHQGAPGTVGQHLADLELQLQPDARPRAGSRPLERTGPLERARPFAGRGGQGQSDEAAAGRTGRGARCTRGSADGAARVRQSPRAQVELDPYAGRQCGRGARHHHRDRPAIGKGSAIVGSAAGD